MVCQGVEFLCEGLSVGHSQKPLLRGVNLRLAPGDRVGIAGPSGCGKTALLRTMCGLLDPLEGELRLGSKAPEAWGYPSFRARVQWVPQLPRFFGGSLEQELARPWSYGSNRQRGSPSLGPSLLAALELSLPLETPVSQLSAGQGARLALARALALQPNVLLLDEPTANLDEPLALKVEQLLRARQRDTPLAIVLVSHGSEQLKRFCTSCFEVQAHQLNPVVGPAKREAKG